MPFIYIVLMLTACTIIGLIIVRFAHSGGLLFGLMLVLLIYFGGARHGLTWSMQISYTIAGEHERSTFSLLSTTPSGAFGSCWVICSATLSKQNRVGEWAVQHVALTRAALSVWAVVLVIFLLMSGTLHDAALIMTIPLVMLAIILIYYLDGRQSIVLGCLLGMLIPLYSRSRSDARLLSTASFLALQVATYLLAWIAAAFILPAVFQTLHVDKTAALVLQAAISIGLFYTLRDIIIRVLWLKLIAQLNVSASEIENLIHVQHAQTRAP